MLGSSEQHVFSYADLFAGCGGLSLGLEWAGFRRTTAIELSTDAALSYFHNLVCREEKTPFQWSTFLDSPELQVTTGLLVGNIKQRFDDFLASCQERSQSSVDLIAGGPPCQGYSTAGKRDPKDPRNNLSDYMVKAIAHQAYNQGWHRAPDLSNHTPRHRWKVDDECSAQKLYETGTPVTDIATKLGRSCSAVLQRAWEKKWQRPLPDQRMAVTELSSANQNPEVSERITSGLLFGGRSLLTKNNIQC